MLQGLYIFVLAMLPIAELRVSIPLGIALGIEPWLAFFYSVLGNGVAAVVVAFLLPFAYRILYRFHWVQIIWDKLAAKTHNKGEKVERYGALGLLLFVAIPLPGTGVWTGVLLAFLLGIRPRYALPAILSGMVLAGLVMTLASIGVVAVGKYAFGLETIALLALIAIALWFPLLNLKQEHLFTNDSYEKIRVRNDKATDLQFLRGSGFFI